MLGSIQSEFRLTHYLLFHLFFSFDTSSTKSPQMATNRDIPVYMAPPPSGRPRFDGSPTRQFAMGLVSIMTTAIGFAVVALRILTRKHVVKMPLRVDDCGFCRAHQWVGCGLIINPDFAVAAVIASILLVISNAIRMPTALYFC